MDLSFTEDSNWIARRVVLWNECLEYRDWEDELSTKQIDDLHSYFFTGRLVKCKPASIRSRLLYFPAMTIEAIEHVLRYNMPEGATDKDISHLKLFFSVGITDTPDFSNEEAAKIFTYVFGDRYVSEWQLPFLIDGESTYRRSELGPNHQFQCGVRSLWWLNGKYDNKDMWTYLKDYWLSLLPYVDPILFRPGDRSYRPPNVMINITPKNLRQLLGFCAHGIDISRGEDWGEERRQFMRDVRLHLEEIDGPSDLMTLWQGVKNADPSEFVVYV